MFSMPAAVVVRIREALARPVGESRISRTDIAEVVRLAEQAERLLPFATHRPACEFLTKQRPYGGTMLPGPCTCGLADVQSGRWAGEADPVSMRARAERGR